MSAIRWPDDDAPVSAIGGKAAALARLVRAGFDVPPFFVVAADAGLEAAEIRAALARLAPEGGRFAVRSSAAEEDGAGHSFAGQFESYLNVDADDVVARVA